MCEKWRKNCKNEVKIKKKKNSLRMQISRFWSNRRSKLKNYKYKNVSVKETVDKKFSDKMKASKVLEEVVVKCTNCGKTSKLNMV